MKNLIFTCLFLTIFFFGCDSTTENFPDPGSYPPLKDGNKWYYNSHSRFPNTTSVDIIWEVSGQEEKGGKNYFRIIEHNLHTNYLDTLFYRFNGDTLFSWNINNE